MMKFQFLQTVEIVVTPRSKNLSYGIQKWANVHEEDRVNAQ